MTKTTFDERGVKQDFYEYVDDNSFQRAGELVAVNVRTVTQKTLPSGEWIDAESITKTGFNCTRRKAGPLQPPLSSKVVQHNVDGTLTDVTSATKAQAPALQVGLTRTAGPDDKDFAYACAHRF